MYLKVLYCPAFVFLFDPQIVQAISKGTEADLFVHYMFMDNEFELPTGAGFQLQVALSGIMTPGAKAGMKMHYQKHVRLNYYLHIIVFQQAYCLAWEHTSEMGKQRMVAKCVSLKVCRRQGRVAPYRLTFREA